MKAAVLIQHGKPESSFEIRNINQPTIQEHEVLIKVACFGLNFADVLARNGLYGDAPTPPSVLGYECAGIVEQVGNKVTKVKAGDRVLAFNRFNCYAEFTAVPEMGVEPIPDNLSFEDALPLATQYCTAYYCAVLAGNFRKGERVLIHSAAGGVGIAALQILTNLGVEVHGTVGSTQKIETLKQMGFTTIINYKTTDFFEYYKSKNIRFDGVFDPIGGKTFKKGKKLLNYGGRIITYGASERFKKGLFPTLKLAYNFGLIHPVWALMKSMSVIGVNMLRIADYRPQEIEMCLQACIDLYTKNVVKPVVDSVYNATEIGAAHARLESGKSIGKVVVKW